MNCNVFLNRDIDLHNRKSFDFLNIKLEAKCRKEHEVIFIGFNPTEIVKAHGKQVNYRVNIMIFKSHFIIFCDYLLESKHSRI